MNKKAFAFYYLDKLTAYCGKLPLLGERAGVRGQQAFISHHLDSCHSKLVSEFTTYQNWRKLPPLKGEGWGEGSTSFCKAFTLAEVLITLAIIGVVAAMAIPSVISNAQQQEFKTGLRKAVSVLNSAITMNIALDGETPYDNHDLFRYLQRHMSVMSSNLALNGKYRTVAKDGTNYYNNGAFYTTDGMRFEFSHLSNSRGSSAVYDFPLYETSGTKACLGSLSPLFSDWGRCGTCGSYGLNNNPDKTTKAPCLIMVDVNGDRKPNPANIYCKQNSCSRPYIYADPKGKKLTDVFSIMITDKQAIPYGAAAQKAMYQAQK